MDYTVNWFKVWFSLLWHWYYDLKFGLSLSTYIYVWFWSVLPYVCFGAWFFIFLPFITSFHLAICYLQCMMKVKTWTYGTWVWHSRARDCIFNFCLLCMFPLFGNSQPFLDFGDMLKNEVILLCLSFLSCINKGRVNYPQIVCNWFSWLCYGLVESAIYGENSENGSLK